MHSIKNRRNNRYITYFVVVGALVVVVVVLKIGNVVVHGLTKHGK